MPHYPCKFGTACTKSKCKFFHGTALIKVSKPCMYGTKCKKKEKCPFLHKGEDHLLGKIFWQATPIPQTPKATNPPILRPPAPLDNPPILQSIADFLGEKDRVAIRSTSKCIKNTMDTLIPIQDITIGNWIPKSTKEKQYLRSIIINSTHPYRPFQESLLRDLFHGASNTLTSIRINSEYFSDYETLFQMQSLKSLSIYKSYFSSSFYSIHTLKSLEKLKCTWENFLDWDRMIQSLAQLPKLKSLVINCMFVRQDFDFDTLQSCKSLKSLEVLHASSNQVMKILNLPLEKINLRSCVLPAKSHMLDTSINASSLLSLKIESPHSYDRSNYCLSTLLETAKNLHSLVLGYMEFPSTEFLSSLKQLKKLTIHTSKIVDIPEFFKNLPNGLECLYIHGSGIDYLSHLSPHLSRLNLWALGLNGNPIVDMPSFCEALANDAKGLEVLGMTLPHLTFESAKECLEHLSKLPHLHHTFLYTKGYNHMIVKNLTDAHLNILRKTYLKSCNRVLVTSYNQCIKEQKVRLNT